jgi:hypothetical protein
MQQESIMDVQKLGNVAQWTSAVASILTLLVAIYGISSAVPYFQLKVLQEKYAGLERERDQITSEVADLKQIRAKLEGENSKLRPQLRRATLLAACSQVHGNVIAIKGLPRGHQTVVDGEVMATIRQVIDATLSRMQMADQDRIRIRRAWEPALAKPAPQSQNIQQFAFELWRLCEPVAPAE